MLQGYRYSSKTSHPRFSAYRDKSAEWRCTKKERAAHRPNWATPEQIEKFLKMDQRKRTTSAYEWIGKWLQAARDAEGRQLRRRLACLCLRDSVASAQAAGAARSWLLAAGLWPRGVLLPRRDASSSVSE